jgi:hypothetical protein
MTRHWIDIDTAKPEPEDQVLALFNALPLVATWDGDQWKVDGRTVASPTHWTFLPELPEEVVKKAKGRKAKKAEPKVKPDHTITPLLVFRALLEESVNGPTSSTSIGYRLVNMVDRPCPIVFDVLSQNLNSFSENRILVSSVFENEGRYAVDPDARAIYEWLIGLTRPIPEERLRYLGQNRVADAKKTIRHLHRLGILQYVEHPDGIKGYLINGITPTFDEKPSEVEVEKLILKVLSKQRQIFIQKGSVCHLVTEIIPADYGYVMSCLDGLVDRHIITRHPDSGALMRVVEELPEKTEPKAAVPAEKTEPKVPGPLDSIPQPWKDTNLRLHPDDLYVVYEHSAGDSVRRVQHIPADTPARHLPMGGRIVSGRYLRELLYLLAISVGDTYYQPLTSYELRVQP